MRACEGMLTVLNQKEYARHRDHTSCEQNVGIYRVPPAKVKEWIEDWCTTYGHPTDGALYVEPCDDYSAIAVTEVLSLDEIPRVLEGLYAEHGPCYVFRFLPVTTEVGIRPKDIIVIGGLKLYSHQPLEP